MKVEEVIEPDLLICDAHHHLWDRPGKPYLLDEFRSDTNSGHRVERSVFIECGSSYRTDGPEAFRPVGETEFVVSADPEGFIAGIVGFADLRVPEIADVLAAHIEAGAGRFRGIRHSSTWSSSPEIPVRRPDLPNLLGDIAFRSGLATLGRAGLSYDAWLYHPQITELTDLARALPDLPIILDHLGGPLGIGPYRGQRNEVLAVWRPAIKELATCSNVSIKLGGIGMSMFGIEWHGQPGAATSEEMAAAWRGEILWCIEQFGVDRCMFESNFPPDKKSCSYLVLWNAFKRMTADASPAEKQALFHDTATKIYAL